MTEKILLHSFCLAAGVLACGMVGCLVPILGKQKWILGVFKRLPNSTTISSTPQQDIEMIQRVRSEIGNPPLYSFFFNNCIHWANKVIDYGMDK